MGGGKTLLLHGPASPESKKHSEEVSRVCFCGHVRSFLCVSFFFFLNKGGSKCKLGIEVSSGYDLRVTRFPVLFIASVNLSDRWFNL